MVLAGHCTAAADGGDSDDGIWKSHGAGMFVCVSAGRDDDTGVEREVCEER